MYVSSPSAFIREKAVHHVDVQYQSTVWTWENVSKRLTGTVCVLYMYCMCTVCVLDVSVCMCVYVCPLHVCVVVLFFP